MGEPSVMVGAFVAALVAFFTGVVAPTYISLRNQLKEAKDDYNEKIKALEIRYQLHSQKLEADLNKCEKERELAILWRARYEERVNQLEKAAVEGKVTAIPDDNGILRIVSVNIGMCKLFGYTRPELMGMDVEELIAFESREAHREKTKRHLPLVDNEFSRVLNGGVALKKDGTEFPVTVELQTITLHGRPAWSAVITQD